MIKNNTKMTSETQNIGFINSTSYCKIDLIDIKLFLNSYPPPPSSSSSSYFSSYYYYY